MFVDGSLGLRPCFAGLNTLVPRVTKVWVSRSSTVFEPRTSSTATTTFARFRDGSAFDAYGTARRCHGCWCLHAALVKDTKNKKLYQSLFSVSEDQSLFSMGEDASACYYSP